MNTTPTILADGILEATVTHGVARITLAEAAAEPRRRAGKPSNARLSRMLGPTETASGRLLRLVIGATSFTAS
jgi:hypothetical protein